MLFSHSLVFRFYGGQFEVKFSLVFIRYSSILISTGTIITVLFIVPLYVVCGV